MNEILEAIKFCYMTSFVLFILCVIFDKGPLTVKTLILAILILGIPILNLFTYLFTFYKILLEYDKVKEFKDSYFILIKKIGDLIIKFLNYRLK